MKAPSSIQRQAQLPDQIAAALMSQITSGDLQPGDTLPPELQLAEMFDVSRNVVREAIARLRADGVIATRQGRGATVLPQSQRTTFRIDLDPLAQAGNLSQLFELRRLLEIEAAGRAAQRHDAPQLAALKEATARMEQCAVFDDRLTEADADFHRLVAAASGNAYLAGIIDYLAGRLEQTNRATGEIYAQGDLLQVTIAEHKAILASIEARDATAAEAAMRAHIHGAATRLQIDLPQPEP